MPSKVAGRKNAGGRGKSNVKPKTSSSKLRNKTINKSFKKDGRSSKPNSKTAKVSRAKKQQMDEDERKFMEFTGGVKPKNKFNNKDKNKFNNKDKNKDKTVETETQDPLSNTKLKRKAYFEKLNEQKKKRLNGEDVNDDDKDDGFEVVPKEFSDSGSDDSETDTDDNDGWESGSDLEAMPEEKPLDDGADSDSHSIISGELENDFEEDGGFDEKIENIPIKVVDKSNGTSAIDPNSKRSLFSADYKEEADKEDDMSVKKSKNKYVKDVKEMEDEDSDDINDDDFLSAKSKIELTKQIQSANRKGKKSGGFQSMGLSNNMYKAIKHMGYKVPTPIQRKTIPVALEGRDVVAMARTGSGKTAAFIIPMIEKLKVHSAKVGVRGIIITPSRELAQQTYKFVKDLGKYTDLRYCMLVGGDTLESQFNALHQNPDIIIVTPGRLMHLIIEMNLDFKTVECVVYDEADRLFELGFEEQLREILFKLPEQRQSFLFSATLPRILVDFAKAGLVDPVLVRLDIESKFSDDLQNYFFSVKHEEREAALLYMFKHLIPDNESTIVFVSTKHHVDYVHELLNSNDISNTYIYGPLDMAARRSHLLKFRDGKVKVLVVTDVAARGIDIPLLDNVINYDFPAASKVFVHRVGRSARAGRSGRAFSFVSPEEVPYLIDLQLFSSRPLILSNTFKPETWIDENGNEANASLKPTYTKSFVLGSLPPSALGDIFEFLSKKIKDDIQLSTFRNNSRNAYKLYSKSKPAASSESYTRAKELTSSFPGIHPIFITGIESLKKEKVSSSLQDDDEIVAKLREKEELQKKRALVMKREIEHADVLSKLANFRPLETIFEVQKRRFGKTSMVTGHATSLVNKNPILVAQMNEAMEAANIMSNHRKAFSNVISKAQENKKEIADKLATQQRKVVEQVSGSTTTNGDDGFKVMTEEELQDQFSTIITGAKKRNISKKRRNDSNDESQPKKSKVKESYKDEKYYMGYKSKNYETEKGYEMNNKSDSSFALNASAASYEITADDNDTLRRGKGGLTWDSKKRNFVRETIGSDNKKKIRTESGNIVNASFKTNRFEMWKKQTHTDFAKVGELERVHTSQKALNHTGKIYRHISNAEPTPGSNNQRRKQAAEEAKLRREGKLNDKALKNGKNKKNANSNYKPKPNKEMKSTLEIAKERIEKEKRRLKNARPSKKQNKKKSRS